MAHIGSGRQPHEEQVASEDIPMKDGGIDYAALYDKVDATKVSKSTAHAGVGADQIRDAIRGIFAGKPDTTQIRVSFVADVVNEAYKLTTKETKVQYSSVVSAGTAGGEFLKVVEDGQAYFTRNPEFKPKA